jgi:hypothetical protein
VPRLAGRAIDIKRHIANDAVVQTPAHPGNGGIEITAIPQELRKNGWKFDENLPHGRS